MEGKNGVLFKKFIPQSFWNSHPKILFFPLKRSLEKALRLIFKLNADFRGTELYPPLKDHFEKKCKFGQRQFFIITDGEVENVEKILDLISKKSKDNRCFTIGIGRGCDTCLVEGMARESDGKCDFVLEGDSISEKVIPQLKYSLIPCVDSIEVHNGGEGNDAFEVSPFPISNIPANVLTKNNEMFTKINCLLLLMLKYI